MTRCESQDLYGHTCGLQAGHVDEHQCGLIDSTDEWASDEDEPCGQTWPHEGDH